MERSTQLHQTAGSAEARDAEETCPNEQVMDPRETPSFASNVQLRSSSPTTPVLGTIHTAEFGLRSWDGDPVPC